MKTGYAIIIATMIVLAPPVGRAGVLTGPITNEANGHLYYLLTPSTWSAAEAEATSLGGHLVTMNDTNENHWVYTNFAAYGGVARALWIGLTERRAPGNWEWVSSEPVTLTNYWISGQPNNAPTYGPQHWAMLWPVHDGVSLNDREKWNDYWDVTTTMDFYAFNLHGVVEVRPRSTNAAPTAAIRRAVEVSFPTVSNQWYRVEYALVVDTNVWRTLSPYVLGNGSVAQVFDVTESVDQKFYRVVPIQP